MRARVNAYLPHLLSSLAVSGVLGDVSVEHQFGDHGRPCAIWLYLGVPTRAGDCRLASSRTACPVAERRFLNLSVSNTVLGHRRGSVESLGFLLS